MNPRPVPSECLDSTPPGLWGVLWELDADGTMEMPADFWKGPHYYSASYHASLPPAFWNRYRQLFPEGHRPNYHTRCAPWDDRAYGYWRGKDGLLQYRSPDGTVRLGVTGDGDFWDEASRV